MKRLKLLFLLFLVSCASVKVTTDYDPTTNYSKYTSFLLFDDFGKGFSELDKKRIERILERKLLSKGISVDSIPDFYINIVSEEKIIQQRNILGIGVGGGRNVGFGISGGIPIDRRTIRQEIVLDFVDAQSNTVIWQGTGISNLKENLTPLERDNYYLKIIDKLLLEYPPKK